MVTDNREFARLYVEEFINKRNFAIAEEMLAEDYVYHGPNGPSLTGRDAYAKGSAAFLDAFPDWRAELRQVMVDGDMVTDRVHITATHTASIRGVPPSGEKIDDDCAHIWRVKDGKVAEGWLFCNANMLSVMRLASTGS